MSNFLALRVHHVTHVALGVRSFELVPAGDSSLPAVEAGAHIELSLGEGLARSYSLLNEPGEVHRYVIAVHLSPESAGGSRFMHERVQEGQVIEARGPSNHFPLKEDAAHTCLVAGGIGVTPILAMARRLTQLGRSWEVHYCARTRAHAAFVDELRILAETSGNIARFYYDQEPNGQALNLQVLVQRMTQDTHLYCCGPRGMLEAFESATSAISERRHLEYFGARQDSARDGGFFVELAKSGKRLEVKPGRSILDVVLDAGIAIASSCREGICGSCETRILCGQADHRDALLSDDEKAQNQTMMICCSGAKTPVLVLDL
jgi:vanillate O-demethylase ferredoxin subunit